MKAVILAGGLGTRLGNLTETIPKPMVKIGNKPIMCHIIDYFSRFGFNDFLIAAGYKKEKIAQRQLGRVWVVGSNKKTAPLIDQCFKKIISILEDHFINFPFLLGSRPSSADFAFFGQLSQLVGFDPTPRSIIEKNSMRTMAWVGKTEDLSGLEPDSEDWISDSKLPETIKKIFCEVGKTYVPTMLKNEEAFNSGEEKWSAEILGREWEQRTFPYQVKCLKWIRDEFRSLVDKDQQKVLDLLKDTDCERILN